MQDAVGPVLRMGNEVEAVVAAIREDNPDTEIEVIDRGAYVRVQAPGKLVLTEETLREYLGEEFRIRSLENMLTAFAGRISTTSDRIEWESGARRKAGTTAGEA